MTPRPLLLFLLIGCSAPKPPELPDGGATCHPRALYPCIAEITPTFLWPCHYEHVWLCAECELAKPGCFVADTNYMCVAKCDLCNPFSFQCVPQGGSSSNVVDPRDAGQPQG